VNELDLIAYHDGYMAGRAVDPTLGGVHGPPDSLVGDVLRSAWLAGFNDGTRAACVAYAKAAVARDKDGAA
jgi:hypothetical protein